MSRLIKRKIDIPEGTEVKIQTGKIVAKGKIGSLTLEVPKEIKVVEKDNQLEIQKGKKTFRTKQLLGTYHALVRNLLEGVNKGHQKVLTYKGVGYQVEAQKNKLTLKIGYSHPVEIIAPEEIEFQIDKNKIIVKGVDKQMVGEIAAKVRKVRPVDPYKQKGIKYEDERVIEKEGKTVEGLEEGV